MPNVNRQQQYKYGIKTTQLKDHSVIKTTYFRSQTISFITGWYCY